MKSFFELLYPFLSYPNCNFAVSFLRAWNWVSNLITVRLLNCITRINYKSVIKLIRFAHFPQTYATTAANHLNSLAVVEVSMERYLNLWLFSRALNYGSIGSILAHEITHGFDDVGRHFDEDGNKNLWWTNTTISKFVNRYRNHFSLQFSVWGHRDYSGKPTCCRHSVGFQWCRLYGWSLCIPVPIFRSFLCMKCNYFKKQPWVGF